MTPEELTELKALEAAATPGPWQHYGRGWRTSCEEWQIAAGRTWQDQEANAALIAAMRNRLPGLLELVDKQTEQLKRTYCTYCGTEFLLDDDAGNQVTEHIYTCQEHPMWQLQERVQELERHFSSEANSEHIPTSGDLL